MAKTYKGTDGDDIVNQNNGNHNYYNIYTYGGDDQIKLTLTWTNVEAGSGDDKVTSKIEGNNAIKLGSGDDTYIGNGYSHNRAFDKVFGNGGNDTFTVATRQSDYHGDSGNDTFNSAGYWNNFYGGKGNDTISYQRQDTDNFLEGRGVKVDLFHEYSTTGGGRKEHIYDVENAIGTSYADTVIGDNGNNKLWGMDGNDVLDGRGGKDKLYGGNGNDNLYGGGKADMLTGGRGNDRLEGGSGSDTFIFEKVSDSKVGSNRDVITDFKQSEHDQIDLHKIDAISGGSDDAFTFIGTDAFSGTAGELRFKNGILAGDTDGDGKANFEIRVDNHSTLQDTDFIL